MDNERYMYTEHTPTEQDWSTPHSTLAPLPVDRNEGQGSKENLDHQTFRHSTNDSSDIFGGGAGVVTGSDGRRHSTHAHQPAYIPRHKSGNSSEGSSQTTAGVDHSFRVNQDHHSIHVQQSSALAPSLTIFARASPPRRAENVPYNFPGQQLNSPRHSAPSTWHNGTQASPMHGSIFTAPVAAPQRHVPYDLGNGSSLRNIHGSQLSDVNMLDCQAVSAAPISFPHRNPCIRADDARPTPIAAPPRHIAPPTRPRQPHALEQRDDFSETRPLAQPLPSHSNRSNGGSGSSDVSMLRYGSQYVHDTQGRRATRHRQGEALQHAVDPTNNLKCICGTTTKKPEACRRHVSDYVDPCRGCGKRTRKNGDRLCTSCSHRCCPHCKHIGSEELWRGGLCSKCRC